MLNKKINEKQGVLMGPKTMYRLPDEMQSLREMSPLKLCSSFILLLNNISDRMLLAYSCFHTEFNYTFSM